MKTFVLTAIASLMLTTVLSAQEIEPIPQDVIERLAPRLVEDAGKKKAAKIQIDAEVSKANGFHVPEKMGALIVPQKDLKESEELAAKFKTENGAPLGYLFLYNIVPVVDGKKIDANQLQSLSLTTDDGTVRTIHVLPLAVKQLAGDDYRLHAYGTGAKPIIDSKFAEGTGAGPEPVAVEVKDPDHSTKQGKMVVTVFGKFQASFTGAYTGE